MRSAKSFCTFSADNWEPSTGGDCSGSGESRGWVLAVRWSSSSTLSRRRRMSDACGWETRSGLEDQERWHTTGPMSLRWRWPGGQCGRMTMRGPGAGRRGWLTALGWSSGPPMMRRWTPAWRQGWTPSKPPSHVGPKRTTRGSRAIPGLAVRWRRRWRTTTRGKWWARPPRTACPWGALTTFWWTGLTETSRLSHRECLAGGDRCLVGEEESGDTWGRLTLVRFLSIEDLSHDLLRRRTLLPACFDPALRWAHDASRSSEGLSCRSESGPMFAEGTVGPTVCWGGASPTNCCQ